MTRALVLLALAPAYAQKTSATVNIPFSFTVDDVAMPAGEYVISSLNDRVSPFNTLEAARLRPR